MTEIIELPVDEIKALLRRGALGWIASGVISGILIQLESAEQGLFDTYSALGFDTDGARTPRQLFGPVMGMSPAEMTVQAAKEFRADSDAENAAAEARVVELENGVREALELLEYFLKAKGESDLGDVEAASARLQRLSPVVEKVTKSVPTRMKITKARGKVRQPYSWSCPCCLNFPGRFGYKSYETAYAAALVHAQENHAHTFFMDLEELLSIYADGDEHGWDFEFGLLQQRHSQKLDMLATSIQETGIQTPILLGNDGRIWDGHHRLCVANMLGLEKVPVQYASRLAMPERRI